MLTTKSPLVATLCLLLLPHSFIFGKTTLQGPPDQGRIGIPDVVVDDLLATQTLKQILEGLANNVDVIFSDDIYEIDEPIIIEGKENIHFFGEHRDTTILQLTQIFYDELELEFSNSGDSLIPLTINDCAGLKFAKMQWDGRGDEFWQSTGIYGILIMDCNKGGFDHGVHFSSCKFKDLGGNDGPATDDPKGGHVFMFAREFDNDLTDPNSTGKPFKTGTMTIFNEFMGRSAISNCDDNRFQSCHFIDDKNIADFGLRVLSDWSHAKAIPDQSCNRTIVKNCLFRGGFDHNALEIAGPMTQLSRIEDNLFKDTRLTPMEADKGASNNKFLNNVIDGVTSSQHHTQVIAIRDAGFPANSKGRGNLEWLAVDNKYIGNTIKNVQGGSPHRTAALLLRLSKNCVFESNCIEDSISQTGTSPDVPAVILLEGYSENTTLVDNAFPQNIRFTGVYDDKLKKMGPTKNYVLDFNLRTEDLGPATPPPCGTTTGGF